MPVTEIILMRHAEKPDVSRHEVGLSPDGQPDEHALSARGWQRAGALALLLGDDRRVQADLRRPDRIMASAFHKDGGHSRRPEQTVQPLAGRLSLAVDLDWGLNQESELAATVRMQPGRSLICWQHEGLAALARAIVAPDPLPGIGPGWLWPADRFDIFWVLRRESDPGVWRFAQYCQALLPGDGDRPLVLDR